MLLETSTLKKIPVRGLARIFPKGVLCVKNAHRTPYRCLSCGHTGVLLDWENEEGDIAEGKDRYDGDPVQCRECGSLDVELGELEIWG